MDNTPLKLTLRLCTADDIISNPNFEALGKEYAAESANKRLPMPTPDLGMYQGLIQHKDLHVIGAFDDANLIGIMTILYAMLPHFGIPVAMSESFFVVKEARKHGVGQKLWDAGELYAESLGSPGFYMSAPFGSRLARGAQRKGYFPTNLTLYKPFNE